MYPLKSQMLKVLLVPYVAGSWLRLFPCFLFLTKPNQTRFGLVWVTHHHTLKTAEPAFKTMSTLEISKLKGVNGSVKVLLLVISRSRKERWAASHVVGGGAFTFASRQREGGLALRLGEAAGQLGEGFDERVAFSDAHLPQLHLLASCPLLRCILVHLAVLLQVWFIPQNYDRHLVTESQITDFIQFIKNSPVFVFSYVKYSAQSVLKVWFMINRMISTFILTTQWSKYLVFVFIDLHFWAVNSLVAYFYQVLIGKHISEISFCHKSAHSAPLLRPIEFKPPSSVSSSVWYDKGFKSLKTHIQLLRFVALQIYLIPTNIYKLDTNTDLQKWVCVDSFLNFLLLSEVEFWE